jgi:acid stress-induced BolA-like protein IbaG/YrbA
MTWSYRENIQDIIGKKRLQRKKIQIKDDILNLNNMLNHNIIHALSLKKNILYSYNKHFN